MSRTDNTILSTVTKATDSLTILMPCSEAACAKRYFRNDEGKVEVEGYGQEAFWDVEEHAVHDLDSLAQTLEGLSKRNDCIVIYGEPIRKLEKVLRRKEAPGAAFRAATRHWLAIDVDGLDIDEPTSLDAIERVWESRLPEPLQKVSCWWQLTSSAGIKPGMRVRFWFWMDQAVDNRALIEAFRDDPVADECVFRTVQPIYVNNPIFEGIKDPVTHRTGRMSGFSDVVSVAELGVEAALEKAQGKAKAIKGVRRADVDPNPAQIAHATENILSQETMGARHHHALGAACELYALGADVDDIVEVCETIIRKQGRDPEPYEAAGLVKHAASKERAGKLTSKVAPINELLDDDEGAELADDLMPQILVYNKDANDLHNAKAFVQKQFNNGYMRMNQTDWYWTGTHWCSIEDSETLVSKLAQSSGDEFGTKRLGDIVKRTRAQFQRETVDNGQWLDGKIRDDAINLQNGMLYVQDALLDPEGALQDHDQNYFSSVCLPFEFDPDATCPTWERCLSQWFPEDAASIRELQKMFGYLLISDNSLEKFFVLTDRKNGRTGKGTVCTVLGWMLGANNTGAISVQGLGAQFGLSQLTSKTAAFINEANVKSSRDIPQLAIDRLKAITGNDAVEVERKYGNTYNTLLMCRFVLSCNNLPNLQDPSGALLKRMHIIEFLQSFTGREDTTLKKVGGPLYRELAGIFNWALRGLDMLQTQDKHFIELESAKDSKDIFRRQSAPIQSFVDDCLEFGSAADSSYVIEVKVIYEAYRAWCNEQGLEHPLSKMRFAADVRPFVSACMPIRPRTAHGRPSSYAGCRLSGLAKDLLMIEEEETADDLY